MPKKIVIESQGSLLKVKTTGGAAPDHEYAKRGEVVGFSKKSRKRLLELFASLKPVKKTTFITLTYPQEFPDARKSKCHLRAFLERLRRNSNTASGVWRLEFQKRGAPHFHLILFGCDFIPKEAIQTWWAEIIDYPHPFTRIELILSHRKVMSYVAKYVAKPTSESEEGGDGGFNIVPYLHAGRVWGCFRKELFPFDEKYTVESEVDEDVWFGMREVAKQIYPNLFDMYPNSGFTLFMEAPETFIDQVLQWFEENGEL